MVDDEPQGTGVLVVLTCRSSLAADVVRVKRVQKKARGIHNTGGLVYSVVRYNYYECGGKIICLPL